MKQIHFKPYNQGQTELFPSRLDEFIPENAPVRIVSQVVEELDIDDVSVKEIGFERLQLIKPYVQKANWNEREAWIQKASETPTNELRSEIKELKKQEKAEDTDLKKVFIDQYLEKMTTYFNCAKAELNFKLALYFQDADLDQAKKIIKERQRAFELATQKEETP